ncbi:GNAT family N-acetyltransferase [Clostridium estertheticum]|uniref:GNAT family N-acetyltransferase n=1 Tax=Clostridium estertheticum TaxID=238834 RepID=UPI001CF54BCC|nr:GNAT family protein [Clostridium estertheticum]MCB2307230.1 GNAT family N-acetyltransferase [Clostridium estertheticum]MCB2344158.1 GNAT family N-acetyltransferase [Clostridium estertheticum]MCB2348228.1 GNAT family N-acetyltransferase [Clostridium estertheticum]WAG45863.1 GNAT family N-acetyltransferase [Clostridium estertheticum]
MKNLLMGKKVKLTSINEEDMLEIQKWHNDVSFMRNYDVVSATPKNFEDVLETINDVRRSNTAYTFAVKILEKQKIIGVTGFENIYWNNGTALIYIGLGESGNRGQGYGKEALKLTIEFGFEELNFHRIYLTVLEYNEPAIKLYEKLGFKREGVYREFIHRDGRRYDMYLYGLLRPEWEEVSREE